MDSQGNNQDEPNEIKYAIAYCRVSSDLQTINDKYQRNHVSLAQQLDRCRKQCELHGLTIRKIYEEVGSATSLKSRPKLMEALLDLRPKETLIVYSISRLSRSLSDFVNLTTKLKEENKNIVSCVENLQLDTAMGNLLATLLASFAAYESSSTSERVSHAMQFAKKNGMYMSKPPFGYSRSKKGHLIRNEEELKILSQIFNYRDQKYAYKSIAKIMTKENL